MSSIRSEVSGKCEYEIVLVGDSSKISMFAADDVKIIEFDESIKRSWITRKKNLIAQNCKFNKISMHHDYVAVLPGWFENFEKFGNDWDVAMTRVENVDGSRFRDWVSWYEGAGEKIIQFLKYDDHTQTDQMYVSGSYFCVKKQFLLLNPFDENLCWGQGEDVEWSKRVRNSWNYKMNFRSSVRSLKMKHKWPAGPDPFDSWYRENI
jgi:hypothetical protein